MKNFFFHFPGFDTFISGGNSYNKKFEQVLLENHPIKKVNRLVDADVVISDTIFLENFKALDFLHNSNCKKIIIIHHLKYFEENNCLKEFELLKGLDLLIANSEFTSNALQKNGVKSNKIVVVEPPVDIPKNQLNKKEYGSIKALMAANWIERKGFIELLHEIKTIGHSVNNLYITIYGDQTLDKAYYERCVKTINESSLLSRIIEIKEALLPEQMLTIYENYNLYISASKMETYGMSVKEALNSNLPVLALNRGNLAYLVKNPEQGKLFENMNGLVSYLFYLAENNLAFKKLADNLSLTDSESENIFKSQINNFVSKLL